jgi:hypothetical protein
VILQGDKDQTAQPKAQPKSPGGATLDELFRRAGVQSADKIALIDPPNRSSFTDGPPRRLTYAQADRAISALAAKLCRLGLQTDTVVAVQLPNTVESIITLLAVLRAGMIAVPLPLLWRQHDLKAALSNVGAKVIITTSHVGVVPHADIAMQVAADLFPIRFVCAYGSDLADGVVALDDIFAAEQASIVPRSTRIGNAADHVAVVTFDVTPGGLVAVARSHAQLMAGGAAVFLEAGGVRNANILSTVPVSSFAGIAASVMPWLLDGGTLSLHHGFAPATFAAQCDSHIGGMIVLPGPAVAAVAGAGFLAGANTTLLALWRSPEQLAAAPGWRGECNLVDVACFGEVGLILTQRSAYGLPADIPLGMVGAQPGGGAIETLRGKHGTLALRGAMVPAHAFPPGAEYGHGAWLAPDDAGFVDTGYTCRPDPSAQSLTVTGPPGGVTAIGGYRFRAADIEAQVAAIDPAASVTTLPGGVMAQQLAGSAIDTAAVRGRLLANGANPLVAGAFRPRGGLRAA